MGIGSIFHGVKAVGHLCVGDVAGAAVECGKAILGMAVSAAAKGFLGESDMSDITENLLS